MKVTINLECLNGTAKRIEKAFKAAFIIEKVVNSEEFKSGVLSKKFTNCSPLKAEDVLNVIYSGKEALDPKADYEWDFQVSFYLKRFSKVIGYTYPNITVINCNTKFFDSFDAAEVAGNFAHEYCHKLGFDHSSASDLKSVPYSVGYLVESLGKQYL